MQASEPTTPAPNRNLSIILIVVGGLLFVTALCSGVGYLVLPFVQSLQETTTGTSLFSFAALALVYGGILTYVGFQWRRRRPAVPLKLPSPLIFLGAFATVLLVGQLVLWLNIGTAYLFPPFHVLAGLFIPIAILAYASRRLSEVSLRSVLAQFSWGGLATITLALVFEILIGGIFLLVALAAAALIIGMERTTTLVENVQGAAPDPNAILSVLSGEPLILFFAGITVVLLFVLIIPLLEELLKSAGPAIAIRRRIRANVALTKAEVVVWGLAAGAGFAFTENVMNTQGALTGGQGADNLWVGAMLLRTGTTLMHMITTGTVAIGWYYAFVERKRSRFIGLLAAATVAHAVWNTVAIALGGIAAITSLNPQLELLSGCLAILALAMLAGLFLAFLYWLVRLIRWAQPPPVEVLTSSGTFIEIKG